MDMNLVYGILTVVGLIGLAIGINVAKAKGWIKPDALSQLEKIDKLVPVVAGLVNKLTDVDEEDVTMVTDILDSVLNYTMDMVESGNGKLLDEDKLCEHAFNLIESAKIDLSIEDGQLLRNVISIIYLYMVG